MKTFKYRIYPTKGQKKILEKQLEECRWLYNHILQVRIETYEKTGKSLSNFDTIYLLPGIKEERPSLKLVYSAVLLDVCKRVHLAYEAFFRRVKAGEKPGFPRFKGVGRYDSFTFPGVTNNIGLRNGNLILPKVGAIKIVYHRELEGKPKTLTIRRTATGKWFASFSCEVESKLLPVSDEVVGIDLGLASFATFSTGEEIPNPRFYRLDEKDLSRV